MHPYRVTARRTEIGPNAVSASTYQTLDVLVAATTAGCDLLSQPTNYAAFFDFFAAEFAFAAMYASSVSKKVPMSQSRGTYDSP